MKTAVAFVAIFALATAFPFNGLDLVKAIKGSLENIAFEHYHLLPNNAVYEHPKENYSFAKTGNNVTIVMGHDVVVLTESGSKITLGAKGLINAAFHSVLRVTIGGIINTDAHADIEGIDQVSVHTRDHSKVRLRDNAVVAGGAFNDVVVGKNAYVLVGPNSTVVKGNGSVVVVAETFEIEAIREKLGQNVNDWHEAVKAFFD
ncbi:hypothetical protein HDE_04168 [Halotydeus destructor]|nr:hypothetical protein HDE_04168 [Halotydeus destructor]